MTFRNVLDSALSLVTDTFKDPEQLTYKNKLGSTVLFDGIIERNFTEVDMDTEIGVVSNMLKVTAQISSLGGTPISGETITIKSKKYSIYEVRENNFKQVEIYLRKI